MNRIRFFFNPRFWALGIFVDSFPYDYTVGLVVGPLQVEIGLGREYSEHEELDVV